MQSIEQIIARNNPDEADVLRKLYEAENVLRGKDRYLNLVARLEALRRELTRKIQEQ